LVIEPILRRVATLAGERGPAAKLDEAVGLARAIDLDVEQSGIVMLNALRPATFLGKGKVEEVSGLVQSFDAGIVVMDCALSPVQQRNLEKAWNAKVLDRTGLILEIFGRRARHPRRCAPSRACAFQVGSFLDPPRAPARWFWFPRRAWRDSARGRPPHDR